MTNIFKTILVSFAGASRKSSDFSDFFTKSSGDKKKVITQVLREANAEQRKVVEKYRKIPTGV